MYDFAQSTVTCVAFSPDGLLVAIATGAGSVLLVGVDQGELIAQAKLDQEPGTTATALAWRGRSDLWVGTSDGRVSKWTLVSRPQGIILTDLLPSRFERTITYLDCSPEQTSIVVTHGGIVEYWEYKGGDWTGVCEMNSDASAILAISMRNSENVLICSTENCCLWTPHDHPDVAAQPLIAVQEKWTTATIWNDFVACSGPDGIDVFRLTTDQDFGIQLQPLPGVSSGEASASMLRFLPSPSLPNLVSDVGTGILRIVWPAQPASAVESFLSYPQDHTCTAIAVNESTRHGGYLIAIGSTPIHPLEGAEVKFSIWSSESKVTSPQVIDVKTVDRHQISIGGALQTSIQARRMIRRTLGSAVRLHLLYHFFMKQAQFWISPELFDKIPSIRKRYVAGILSAFLILGYFWYTPPLPEGAPYPEIPFPTPTPADSANIAQAHSATYYISVALGRIVLEHFTVVYQTFVSWITSAIAILSQALAGLGQLSAYISAVAGMPLTWLGFGSSSLADALVTARDRALYAACVKAGTAEATCAKQYAQDPEAL
ncbi:hypothetical protein FRB90_002064 [Tulasnella sp. 427]|nr:hypothetical protein FRB90_002064 [Tulasnella sp. 427]